MKALSIAIWSGKGWSTDYLYFQFFFSIISILNHSYVLFLITEYIKNKQSASIFKVYKKTERLELLL